MAWTTPRTWTTDEIVTAAFLNTHLRDNLTFLYSPPVIRVATTAAVSITNNSTTTVNLDAEGFKRDITHSTVTNSSRVTFANTGIYTLTLQVDWDANATGRRYASILLNGTTTIRNQSMAPASGGQATNQLALSYEFDATDYVQVQVYQDSGGSLNAYPNLEVVWVGGA